MPRGRKARFELTPELADRICTELSKGRTLRDVCRDENMPPESTVRQWALEDHNGFYAQYARAREIGYDAMADETIELADLPRLATRKVTKANGSVEEIEVDQVDRSRLQVDTRKWLLAKALPKRYGDRQTLDVDARIRKAEEMSDEELVAIIQGKAAKQA